VRRSLRPVAAAFLVFGAFAGAWAVSAVDVEGSFGLSDLELGLLLGVGVVASTVAAALGGAFSERVGARAALTRALAGWGLLLVVAACSPRAALFAVSFTLVLAAGGVVDVVMNVIAADALSHEPARLVRFHTLFNAGAVLGAAVTGGTLQAGASWRVVWIAVALSALLTAVLVWRAHLSDPPRREHPPVLRAVAGLRHEGLTALAVVFAAAAMVEGGIATWGVLYMRANLGLGVLVGVSAYVIGQTLATLARVGGGPLIAVLGTRRAIVLGGSLAAAGLVAEAVTDHAAIAAAGLAAAAVGISVVWPLLIAEVNNEATHPAIAIGGVTACGYLGLMAGPPIVGIVAGPIGLRAGLLLLAGAAAFVALMPARVRPRHARAVIDGES
jgi:MFS family permease